MNKTGEIKKGMCEKNNLDESQKQAHFLWKAGIFKKDLLIGVKVL